MDLAQLVRLSLDEDIGHGDLTTNSTVPADAMGSARVVAKEELVVAGQAVATEVFRQLGASWEPVVDDGSQVDAGTVIGRVSGPARALLSGERVALNFLMRLSGIATHTRHTVSGIEGLRVVDTRKTTPLHRALERAAVRAGGAANHRFALFDGVLIKENHIMAAGGIGAAVAGARAAAHHLVGIEVEVETLSELDEALAAGADAVMLDNMDDAMVARGVAQVAGRAKIEVSGNITAERLPRLAALGVDLVSIGGLIHQARWVDLSMRWAQPAG